MTRASLWKWGTRFLALCALLLGMMCWRLGTRITAPATCRVARPRLSEPFFSQMIDVPLRTEIGGTCAAWYVPHDDALASVVLAHPLRSNRLSMLERAHFLHHLGYAVLLIDLQAHGESSGHQITFGYRERHDVLAAIAWIREQTPTHKVAVVGRSLGGAAALMAQADGQIGGARSGERAGVELGVDALILESVYPTIEEATHNRIARHAGPLAHILSPMLLLQLPIRLGVSSRQLHPIDCLAKVGCPVLIMSGGTDEHTTQAETERMFSIAQEPKELVIFPDAAHVDLQHNDEQLYEHSVSQFLKRHLGSQVSN